MKAKLVVVPGLTVPNPGIPGGKMMTCKPATVAVLAPVGIVLAATPVGNVTVPPTFDAVTPPIFAKLTVPLVRTLTETFGGTVTRVVTSAVRLVLVLAVAVLLAGVLSAVVLLTAPLKVCTVVLPAGTL